MASPSDSPRRKPCPQGSQTPLLSVPVATAAAMEASADAAKSVVAAAEADATEPSTVPGGVVAPNVQREKRRSLYTESRRQGAGWAEGGDLGKASVNSFLPPQGAWAGKRPARRDLRSERLFGCSGILPTLPAEGDGSSTPGTAAQPLEQIGLRDEEGEAGESGDDRSDDDGGLICDDWSAGPAISGRERACFECSEAAACTCQESRKNRNMGCDLCSERSKLVKCADCRRHHCFRCGAKWRSDVDSYRCCKCMGTGEFIAKRRDEAYQFNEQVALKINGWQTYPNFNKRDANQVLIQYVDMLVVINEVDNEMLREFGPTILQMLDFQRKHRLGSTLTGSLTMRFQLPEEIFNEVVRAASILEEVTRKRSLEPKTKPRRPLLLQVALPVLVYYLYDISNHPIGYLIFEHLQRMLRNGRVIVYILVMRKARQSEYADFMLELKDEFEKKERWKEFKRDNLKGAMEFLCRIKPTIFVDLVGNMHGQLENFPEAWNAQLVCHFLNVGSKTFSTRHHVGIFDRGMVDEKQEGGEGSEEGAKVVSSWQPALPRFLLDKVDRSKKHGWGQFNLFVHVNLDRRSESFGIGFVILQVIATAYLHYQANPLFLVPVVQEEARQFEIDNGLTAGTIQGRLVPWKLQPMDEFIKKLRAEDIHVAISGGPYPAHTGQQVAMAAGIFGVIVPFESMMNRVPRYMNEFVGTGALNPISRQDAIDIILYLHSNRHIVDEIQLIYDYFAVNGRFIFDPDRSVDIYSDSAMIMRATGS